MTIATPLLHLLAALLPLPQDAPDALFPPATADMVITVGEGGQSWTLLDVVQDYAQITGQQMRVDEQSRSYLQAQPTGLTRSVVVPKAAVQSFVEGLLADNGCFLSVLRAEDPRLLAVASAHTDKRQTLRDAALHVPADDIEAWRAHPAVLVGTTIDLPSVDARQIANSLRVLMTDSNYQMITSAGSSSTLLVIGRGPWAANIVATLAAAERSGRDETLSPRFERFPLAHAVAAEVAGLVEELARSAYRAPQATTQPLIPYVHRYHFDARVMADARTNALVVTATAEDLEAIRRLVALVDVPAGER